VCAGSVKQLEWEQQLLNYTLTVPSLESVLPTCPSTPHFSERVAHLTTQPIVVTAGRAGNSNNTTPPNALLNTKRPISGQNQE